VACVSMLPMSPEQSSRQWSSSRAKWLFAIATAFFTSFASNAESASIVVEAKFIDVKGDPVSTNNRPSGSSLTLGIIAGAIGGNPSQTLQVVRIAKLSSIEIDLDSFEAAVIKQAVPMTALFATSGLGIDPVATRFARVSTLLTYSGAHSGDLSVGFVDPDSKKSLTLVYFDRPCRLTGTISIANKGGEELTTVYDVTVEKPGLTWLVRTPQGPGAFVMRVADEPIRQMLVVAPVENRKHGSFQIN